MTAIEIDRDEWRAMYQHEAQVTASLRNEMNKLREERDALRREAANPAPPTGDGGR